MAFEKRELTGALFANRNRRSDKEPQARGYVIINGEEWELAAWTKDGRDGKWQSLSAKRAQPKQENRPPQSRQAAPGQQRYGDEDAGSRGFLDDDLPF